MTHINETIGNDIQESIFKLNTFTYSRATWAAHRISWDIEYAKIHIKENPPIIDFLALPIDRIIYSNVKQNIAICFCPLHTTVYI